MWWAQVLCDDDDGFAFTLIIINIISLLDSLLAFWILLLLSLFDYWNDCVLRILTFFNSRFRIRVCLKKKIYFLVRGDVKLTGYRSPSGMRSKRGGNAEPSNWGLLNAARCGCEQFLHFINRYSIHVYRFINYCKVEVIHWSFFNFTLWDYYYHDDWWLKLNDGFGTTYFSTN